jgi:pyrroline-5-carboxylate reductase
MINKKICFLGAGNMAEAIISGLLKSRLVAPGNITACDIRKERLSFLKKKYKITVESENIKAVSKSDVIFVSVKPKDVASLLCEISPGLSKNKVVVSIAAGITIRSIEKELRGIPVIRTMPNTPLMVGFGAIGLSKGRWAQKKHLDLVSALFSVSGKVVKLPESKLNAVTALSGSGPAYVFYVCEAMEKAGALMGLPKDVSKVLTIQTILGSAKMLELSGVPAQELRRRVTSPGGTTEAAVKYFEANKFEDIFVRALRKAKDRAQELSK